MAFGNNLFVSGSVNLARYEFNMFEYFITGQRKNILLY